MFIPFMLFSHFSCNLFSECFSLYLFHHSSRFTEYILVYHFISTIALFAIHFFLMSSLGIVLKLEFFFQYFGEIIPLSSTLHVCVSVYV